MTVLRHELHYRDRVLRCFRDRPGSLGELLRDALATRPDGDALVTAGGARLSYRALDARVAALAGALRAHGLAPGERLALLLGNRPEFLIAVLAALRCGAIAVPLNVRLQSAELRQLLAHSGAAALIHEAGLASRLPPPAQLPALRRYYRVDDTDTGADTGADTGVDTGVDTGADGTAGAADASGAADPAPPDWPDDVDEHQVAVILYTSGTTGRPKGAMLTHLGILHSVMHYQRAFALQAHDRALLCVPASHVTGLVALLLSMLRVGGCTVLQPAFKAGDCLTLMQRERVSYTLMVPAMYKLCLLHPDFAAAALEHWRVGGYGGAPMPSSTIAELARRLPRLQLANAYGATETTSPTTIMPLGETAAHPDSVGRVVPYGEVRVMDGNGREVAAGEPGEIWIRGPMVVPGYWNDPEATAAAFCAGYWRSGDIGAMDADGYLRVFDRIKDLVNRGGYKIYSVEVENVLNAHPRVVESALVAEPDPVLGEKSRAHVYLRGADADDDAEPVDEAALRRFCAERLADYKVPDFFTFCDRPLPRNAGGKLLKRELRGARTGPA